MSKFLRLKSENELTISATGKVSINPNLLVNGPKVQGLAKAAEAMRLRGLDTTGCAIPRAAGAYPETRHKSPYSAIVTALARQEKIGEPRFELVFHPVRQWRFDIAWPEHKIAIEIDGGIHTGGAHARGKGIENDHEKRNAAVIMGWRVLVYQPSQLTDAVVAARVLMCAPREVA